MSTLDQTVQTQQTRDEGQIRQLLSDQEAAMPDGQGKVSVIDTATSTVITTIRGNPFPSAVTITPGRQNTPLEEKRGRACTARHSTDNATSASARLTTLSARGYKPRSPAAARR